MSDILQFATFDADRGRAAFYFDSYWGGDRYRNPSSPTMGRATLTRWVALRDSDGRETGDFDERVILRCDTYLVPHPGEPVQAFRVRLSLASYVNLCQPIVDSYTDAVTSPVVRDLGALDQYLNNLDGRGRTWSDHLEEVARWSAVYGFCATVIDAPKENPATSRADEERLGVGLRASLIHPTAFAWVAVDDDGCLQEFAFVDSPYLPSELTIQKVRLWVYTTTDWAVYETEVISSQGFGPLRAGLTDLTPTRTGPLPPSISGQVPVRFAYFRQDTSSRTPRGVPLVGDACDLTRQVYNTLSNVEEIHRKTAFPFLAIPEPSNGGDLDPKVRVQVGPDSALGYNSSSGVPSWVQPSSESTKELREHAMFLAMLALRTTGLEVSSSDASPDASGEALKIRSRDFDSRCGRFARGLAAFEKECLGLAAQMLGLTVRPTITYPKRFTLPSPAGDLDRAIKAMAAFGGQLGPSGTEAVIRGAVDAALSLSDEDLNRVMAEVRQRLTTPPAPVAPAAPPASPATPTVAAPGDAL